MSDALDDLPDENFLAADYALGVLSPRDRRRADRLMREDTGFAREVEDWLRRLGPLFDTVEPVAAPTRVWSAIEAELPRPRAVRASPLADARRRVSGFWRSLAIGSMGLAGASLATLVVVSLPAGPAPTLATSIASSSGAPLLTAVIDSRSGEVVLVPAAMTMPQGRVPELWLVPEGGTPISLGVVDPGAPRRIDLSGLGIGRDRMTHAAALAISIEPPGGSPTGQPTGPVVGQGVLQSI